MLAIEIRQTQTFMDNPAYSGVSILNLSKPVTYEFWYDYVKLKYGKNVELSYKDTKS